MAYRKKYVALIVDDDSLVRNIHKKYLSKNGFAIKMAENGHDAVELIRSGNMFDLIVMDLDMPIMNGIQATREIRSMGVRSLVIGMSASTSDTMIQEFISAGLDDYYPTPMNMAKLAAIVRRLE
ncbi:two-component response regulator 24-like [Silene latifolia]|uniref:two-component response regulator 24-like n=1 Tax=Silene latifolia TaxID=37657 RepID=UPI003D779933